MKASRERLKKCRIASNMSIDKVAEALGISRTTYYRYETGAISKIPNDVIFALADMFNTSAAYLGGWDDDSSKDEQKEKEPEIVYYDVNVEDDGITYSARSNKKSLDAECKMLTTLYFLLSNENRLKVINTMQKFLVEQKGGRDDD